MSDRDTMDGHVPGAAAGGPIDDEAGSVRIRRFRRSSQPKAPAPQAPADSVPALLAELMLLREEVATLKAEKHQPPGVGRAIAQARAIPAEDAEAEELADDAAQALVEAHVLRESLLALVGEVQGAMSRVEAALMALGTDQGSDRQDAEREQGSVIKMSSGDGHH